MAKVDQSQGKAEVRILSSVHVLWPLSPLILWGTVEERGKSEPDGRPKRALALPECGFLLQLGKEGQESLIQEDSECSVATCPFLSHQPNEQFLVLSLGPFFLLHEVSRGTRQLAFYLWVLWLLAFSVSRHCSSSQCFVLSGL